MRPYETSGRSAASTSLGPAATAPVASSRSISRSSAPGPTSVSLLSSKTSGALDARMATLLAAPKPDIALERDDLGRPAMRIRTASTLPSLEALSTTKTRPRCRRRISGNGREALQQRLACVVVDDDDVDGRRVIWRLPLRGPADDVGRAVHEYLAEQRAPGGDRPRMRVVVGEQLARAPRRWLAASPRLTRAARP